MHLLLGRDRIDVTQRAVVVGILNRTRDSFFDGGQYFEMDALLRRAEKLVADGADVLEVGARPGGAGVADVSAAEETDLVGSSLAALRQRFDVALAVDTWRAVVAAEAFRCGAVIGNDMSGFSDPDYLPAAVAADASVVATHIRLAPGVPDPDPQYDDVVTDVADRLCLLAQRAMSAGVPREGVILDPGLDLGKTWQQSVRLLAAFELFAGLGFPVLLAASHKIFLGRLLHLEKPERQLATVAACAAGALRGARVLRVHDAAGARQAADLVAALVAADRDRDDRTRP
jgi:dihydropteroate synthase